MTKINLKKLVDIVTDREVYKVTLQASAEERDIRKAYLLLLDKGSDERRLWLIPQLWDEGMYHEAVDLFEVCSDKDDAGDYLLEIIGDEIHREQYEPVIRFIESMRERGYESMGTRIETSLVSKIFESKGTEDLMFYGWLKVVQESSSDDRFRDTMEAAH